MIIHLAISTGRKWNGRTFWNSDTLGDCALVCPCLMKKIRGEAIQTHQCKTSNVYDTIRDRRAWTSVIMQEKTTPTQTYTYERKFCMCGRSFDTGEARNSHIKMMRDDKLPHDIFFDELPRQGGCYIIVDTTDLKVIAVECIRFPISHTETVHSTEAESQTWIETD